MIDTTPISRWIITLSFSVVDLQRKYRRKLEAYKHSSGARRTRQRPIVVKMKIKSIPGSTIQNAAGVDAFSRENRKHSRQFKAAHDQKCLRFSLPGTLHTLLLGTRHHRKRDRSMAFNWSQIK